MQTLNFDIFETRLDTINKEKELKSEKHKLLKSFFEKWKESLASHNEYGFQFEMPKLGKADIIIHDSGKIITVQAETSNWQNGMVEASKHSYYAHQSILLLKDPPPKLALRSLTTFESISVGLWTYNEATNQIIKHHTPKLTTPRHDRMHQNALQKINASKLLFD